MTIDEAYDYIDMLLDKADQPYFTIEEKNRFLNLAISDFISAHYSRLGADEDSRRALSGCFDFLEFRLTTGEILNQNNLHAGSYPALSAKYDEDHHNLKSAVEQEQTGYFLYGNHYVLPKRHLYLLNCKVGIYNVDQVINKSDGAPFSGVDATKVIIKRDVPVDLISSEKLYDNDTSDDPFNSNNNKKADLGKTSIKATYMEGRLIFREPSPGSIFEVVMNVITLPTIEQAFTSETWGNTSIPGGDSVRTFSEHYQKQIIEIAVSKMTKVDVGLMTGPSQ
tara:strand:- start:1918 stop:2757 length:840 start_codon:yes stop_codon:yes gene_type:complete